MSLSVKTRDGKLWGTDDKVYHAAVAKPLKPPKDMYDLCEGHGDPLPFAKSFHFALISL